MNCGYPIHGKGQSTVETGRSQIVDRIRVPDIKNTLDVCRNSTRHRVICVIFAIAYHFELLNVQRGFRRIRMCKNSSVHVIVTRFLLISNSTEWIIFSFHYLSLRSITLVDFINVTSTVTFSLNHIIRHVRRTETFCQIVCPNPVICSPGSATFEVCTFIVLNRFQY